MTDRDSENFFRGLMNGLVLSALLWGCALLLASWLMEY